jgi:hypothetical protein
LFTEESQEIVFIRLSRYLKRERVLKKYFPEILFVAIVFFCACSSKETSSQIIPTLSDQWQFASETSAFIYWKTDQPVHSYVEYGLNTSYGSQTTTQEDNWLTNQGYFSHAHRITGLQRNSTYHFRMVMIDGSDVTARSDDMIFSTVDYTSADRVEVTSASSCNQDSNPADLAPYQYCLDQTGKTYVLTKDITVNSGAIWIQREAITLDLDGHTVIYNNVHDGTTRQRIGVYASTSSLDGAKDVKILNGFIKQGAGNDSGGTYDSAGIGHNPIYVGGGDNVEVAAVSLEWAGSQVDGLKHNSGGIDSRIHHNIFNDLGSGQESVMDRENMVVSIRVGNDGYEIYNNFIKRARHGAIIPAVAGSSGKIYNNEIYMDSWCTNAYGIWFSGPMHDSQATGNRIYATGYHAVAIGTTGGSYNNEIGNNYIEMWATAPDLADSGGRCLHDNASNYGPISSMNGFRILWGDTHNNDYHDNTVIVHGTGGGRARGTWFTTIEDNISVHDNQFRNNTVISYRDSADTSSDTDVCSIRALGNDFDTDATPFYYDNNVIASNVCNIGLGDEYGPRPTNHIFRNNTIRRIGNDSFYNTIWMGNGMAYSNRGHVLQDTTLEDGASLEDVNWDCFAEEGCNYSVDWTLTVNAIDPCGNGINDAPVIIRNGLGVEVFNDSTIDGISSAVLRQYTARGNLNSGTDNYNPYTVTVSYNGSTIARSVEMTAAKTEDFTFDVACVPNDDGGNQSGNQAVVSGGCSINLTKIPPSQFPLILMATLVLAGFLARLKREREA